jgi:hypothetical protein
MASGLRDRSPGYPDNLTGLPALHANDFPTELQPRGDDTPRDLDIREPGTT